MTDPIHIISLGAGVQSSTMALMAAAGEITPMPVAAVFADTQAEPKSVYVWLDWLEKQLPFPIYRVTRGSLEDESTTVFKSATGTWTRLAPPAFMWEDGKCQGPLMRQCTRDSKLRPLIKEATTNARECAGYNPSNSLLIRLISLRCFLALPRRIARQSSSRAQQ